MSVALSMGCLAPLLLAGCGTSSAGAPVPAERPSSTVDSAQEYSLARLCDLLSPAETEEMGGSAQGESGNSVSDGHEQCTWADETSLIIGVQPGVKSNGGKKGPGVTNTPVTVDGLAATQSLETEPIVTCQVLIDMPDGNLLGTSAGALTGGEGKYDPCTLATRMANLIVPRVKDK